MFHSTSKLSSIAYLFLSRSVFWVVILICFINHIQCRLFVAWKLRNVWPVPNDFQQLRIDSRSFGCIFFHNSNTMGGFSSITENETENSQGQIKKPNLSTLKEIFEKCKTFRSDKKNVFIDLCRTQLWQRRSSFLNLDVSEFYIRFDAFFAP